jgi:hypothetical protein
VKGDVIGEALCSRWEDENCTQISGWKLRGRRLAPRKKSGFLVDLASSE